MFCRGYLFRQKRIVYRYYQLEITALKRYPSYWEWTTDNFMLKIYFWYRLEVPLKILQNYVPGMEAEVEN